MVDDGFDFAQVGNPETTYKIAKFRCQFDNVELKDGEYFFELKTLKKRTIKNIHGLFKKLNSITYELILMT